MDRSLEQYIEAALEKAGREEGSRELSLAKTKLQEALFWVRALQEE